MRCQVFLDNVIQHCIPLDDIHITSATWACLLLRHPI
jgi:hypothetical protein